MSKIEYPITVSTGGTNEFKHLKPHTILDLFQYGAVRQSEEYKIDGPSIIQHGVIWILVTNKFEIVNFNAGQGEYKLVTWPRKSNSRIKHFREYLLKDSNNNILVKGTSVWCLFDLNKRLPCSRPEFSFPFDLIDECVLDGEPSKVQTLNLDTLTRINSFKVLRSYYDSNNHTNNAVYAQFIYDSISDNKKIKNMQIDYVSQTYLNDVIDIYSFKIAAELNYFAGYCGEKLIFKSIVKFEE